MFDLVFDDSVPVFSLKKEELPLMLGLTSYLRKLSESCHVYQDGKLIPVDRLRVSIEVVDEPHLQLVKTA